VPDASGEASAEDSGAVGEASEPGALASRDGAASADPSSRTRPPHAARMRRNAATGEARRMPFTVGAVGASSRRMARTVAVDQARGGPAAARSSGLRPVSAPGTVVRHERSSTRVHRPAAARLDAAHRSERRQRPLEDALGVTLSVDRLLQARRPDAPGLAGRSALRNPDDGVRSGQPRHARSPSTPVTGLSTPPARRAPAPRCARFFFGELRVGPTAEAGYRPKRRSATSRCAASRCRSRRSAPSSARASDAPRIHCRTRPPLPPGTAPSRR
jgi:hypothetical protein